MVTKIKIQTDKKRMKHLPGITLLLSHITRIAKFHIIQHYKYNFPENGLFAQKSYILILKDEVR